MCYGCGSPIRTDTSTIPPPPYDLIVRFKERRHYRDPVTKKLKLTAKEENTYYHCMIACIRAKHPGFSTSLLSVTEDLLPLLSVAHKLHLLDNFGVCV